MKIASLDSSADYRGVGGGIYNILVFESLVSELCFGTEHFLSAFFFIDSVLRVILTFRKCSVQIFMIELILKDSLHIRAI